MADELSTFAQGGTVFPLELGAVTNQSLLRDADPSLYFALDFLVGALRAHLGERWTEAAIAAGTPTDVSDNVVAYAVPYDPSLHLQTEQWRFPLFAVYRTRERITEQSTTQYKSVGTWMAQWAMPPLTAAQSEQLMPFLRAVAAVIKRATLLGYDPLYSSGLQVWNVAEIQSANPIAVTYGAMQGVDGLHFPSVLIELEIVERDMAVDGAFDDITSIVAKVDHADAASVTIATIAEMDLPE